MSWQAMVAVWRGVPRQAALGETLASQCLERLCTAWEDRIGDLGNPELKGYVRARASRVLNQLAREVLSAEGRDFARGGEVVVAAAVESLTRAIAARRHAFAPLPSAGNSWAGGNKPRIHNPFGRRLRLIAGLGVLSCCDRIPHFFSKVHLPPVSLTNRSDLRYFFAEPDSLRYASQYVVLHSLTISVILPSRVPRPPPKEK